MEFKKGSDWVFELEASEVVYLTLYYIILDYIIKGRSGGHLVREVRKLSKIQLTAFLLPVQTSSLIILISVSYKYN